MKEKQLLDKYLETYIKQEFRLKDKEVKDYIKSKKLTIRIIESTYKYLSIFKGTKLLYQQRI